MHRRLSIFDTTLRDGEQAPGFSMNLQEKLKFALQLERLGVDVIEAGFAVISPEDYESVKLIAREIKSARVASLARALNKDIEVAWDAVKEAKHPMIHIFLATSPVHMEYKLKMTEEQVLQRAVEAVRYAKTFCSDIEFSAEDASRSNLDFVCRVFEAVINEGATTVNFPDTVGYAMPAEFADMIRYVKNNVSNIDKAVLSVHCHNDLGLAAANSIAAVEAGAGQVECAVNGIGERAGNAALEELAAVFMIRKDCFDVQTGINTSLIYPTSRMLTVLTGQRVQTNKAVVGANAFKHEAGIHQHGVMANRLTYEIIQPAEIGVPSSEIVLGKHSGKHALDMKLKELGFEVDKDKLEKIFDDFKKLADSKKDIDNRDISALMLKYDYETEAQYILDRFIIYTGNTITSTANLRVKHGDDMIEEVGTGDGPVAAAFQAITKITGLECLLESYDIEAVTEGSDAMGTASIRLNHNGVSQRGKGSSLDIIEASILAYLDAINKLLVHAHMRGD